MIIEISQKPEHYIAKIKKTIHDVIIAKKN